MPYRTLSLVAALGLSACVTTTPADSMSVCQDMMTKMHKQGVHPHDRAAGEMMGHCPKVTHEGHAPTKNSVADVEDDH